VWGSTTINIITTTKIAAVVAAVIRITRTTTQQKKRERAKSSSLSLSLSLVSVLLLHSGKEMMEKLTVTPSTTTTEKVEVLFIYVCALEEE